jgi:hypothetical protein
VSLQAVQSNPGGIAAAACAAPQAALLAVAFGVAAELLALPFFAWVGRRQPPAIALRNKD